MSSPSVEVLVDGSVAKKTGHDHEDGEMEDAGVSVLLFPPERLQKRTWSQIFLEWRLWLLDLLFPVTDPAVDMEVSSWSISDAVADKLFD